MRIFRKSEALLLSILGALEQFQSGEVTPVVAEEASARSVANKGVSITLASDCGHQSSNLKRSWAMRVGGSKSHPLSCEATCKKAKMEDGSRQAVFRCYMKTSRRLHNWRSPVLASNPDKNKETRLKKQIANVLISMSTLFEKRMHELNDQSFRFDAMVRDEVLPNHLSQSMLERWEGGLLESIMEIYKIWKPFRRYNTPEQSSVMKEGSELMIDFFIDIQKHQIISNKSLSDFLNSGKMGRLISIYAISRFPIDDSWDVEKVYLNFNLKLSLQENPLTSKMAGILKLLDPDTWKNIELDYLHVQLSLPRNGNSLKGFSQIKKDFLELSSNRKEFLSEKNYRLEPFFHKLVSYISQLKIMSDFELSRKSFIEIKHLNDMINILVDYYPHRISMAFMQDRKDVSSIISTFQESVGLVASLFHSWYIRERLIEVEKKTKDPYLDLLVDLNENRTISRFKEETLQEEVNASEASIFEHKKFMSFQRKVLKASEEIPQKDLKRAILKCRYQEERFISRLSQLENRNNPSDFDFIDLMGYYTQLCYHFLRKYDNHTSTAELLQYSRQDRQTG
ncbi:hypothetical protein PGT21_001654 [Puccinia graminis f. sp. tritici]|uniref:Uncharacterized protein n=1 Tax=Puccinia graminis f. sp. tritici TaxID=56615 RepID=A0A5B0NM00_PUCGR|nr:hypothetical protein PGT21_001654 [Puccinia graminis f. sp. tritici]